MAVNSSPTVSGEISIEATIPPLANILGRWLGVRAVAHLPCRFDCPESVAFAQRLLEIGTNNGYGEEVSWITEILSWPAEWSALHGIAEVKWPIVKLSTRTDATSHKRVVKWVSPKPSQGRCYRRRLPI
jgi:hypothetical protein